MYSRANLNFIISKTDIETKKTFLIHVIFCLVEWKSFILKHWQQNVDIHTRCKHYPRFLKYFVASLIILFKHIRSISSSTSVHKDASHRHIERMKLFATAPKHAHSIKLQFQSRRHFKSAIMFLLCIYVSHIMSTLSISLFINSFTVILLYNSKDEKNQTEKSIVINRRDEIFF